MNKRRDFISIMIYTLFAYGIGYFGFYLWFVLKYDIAALVAISAPVLAYFLVRILRKDTPKVSFKNLPVKSVLWGAGVPIAYTIVSVLLYLCFKGEIAFEQFKLSSLVFSIVQWIFAGFCEEVGWRGFLLPTLKKWNSDTKAYIICGLIWSGWHLPMIYSNTIMTSWPHIIGIILLCIEGIAMTIIIDKIMHLSNMSIWTCIFFHGTHNAIVQLLLTLVPQKAYAFIDDGGYTSLLIIVFTAVIFLIFTKKRKLQ